MGTTFAALLEFLLPCTMEILQGLSAAAAPCTDDGEEEELLQQE